MCRSNTQAIHFQMNIVNVKVLINESGTRIDYAARAATHSHQCTELWIEAYQDFFPKTHNETQLVKGLLRYYYQNMGYADAYVAKGSILDLRTIVHSGDVIEFWGNAPFSLPAMQQRFVAYLATDELRNVLEAQTQDRKFTHFALIRKEDKVVIISGLQD